MHYSRYCPRAAESDVIHLRDNDAIIPCTSEPILISPGNFIGRTLTSAAERSDDRVTGNVPFRCVDTPHTFCNQIRCVSDNVVVETCVLGAAPRLIATTLESLKMVRIVVTSPSRDVQETNDLK